MLDPKIIRDNPDLIRQILKNRAVDFDIDRLLQLDKNRRELILKTDDFRKKRNDISIEIGKKKKTGEDATSLFEEMKKVSGELQTLESDQVNVETEYTKLAATIPNILHDSVPIGPDDSANIEIRKVPKFFFIELFLPFLRYCSRPVFLRVF